MCQVYYLSIPCRSNVSSIKSQSTFVKSNPEDALVLRKRVCQYHTQIMIDCLRSIEITAGYACSLICTASPARKSILDGTDATYTWLMVWSSINLQRTSMSGDKFGLIARRMGHADVSLIR